MSSCQVITGPSQLTTDFVTSTIPSDQLITAPPTTSTTSSPIVTSTCSQPIAIANVSLPLTQCSTYTSYVTGQTVIPGAVATSTTFLTSVYSNVRTLPGAVSTSCIVLPTTAAPTTMPTIAPSTVRRTTTTRVRSPTTVVVPTTTTPTTTAVTTSAVVVSTPIVITSDGEQSTITSFSTLFVTMTDSDGHVSVLTTSSGVSTLSSATEGSGGSRKVHTGAIAGGVVGGIIALLLAIFILVALRRKGCFRSSDEHFDDNIWSPDAHGQGVVGIKARSVNHDEDDDDAEVGVHSGEMMSEKEADDAAMERSRHSWHVRAASFSSEHGQPTIRRISSPTGGHSNYSRPNELTRSASAVAAARVRKSVSAVSSSGHESHESYHSAAQVSAHPQSPTSAAYYQSRRMSQHEFYQQQEQQARARSPTSPTSDYEYTLSPAGGYERSMDHRVDHRRIASHDGMSMMSRHNSVISRHQSYSNHATSPTEVSRRQSFSTLPILNTGAPTRRNSTVASRNNSLHSSYDHSSNLATTGSTSANSHGNAHGNLRPLTSLSPITPSYHKPYDFKRPQLEVVIGGGELPNDSLSLGVVPSLLSSNGSSEDASHDPRPPTPSSAVLVDLPRPGFLEPDRPKMERSSSTSSVIAPSQFLGARIVNVDEPVAVT